MTQLGSAAQQQVQQAQSGFQRMLNEQPLAVGAAAIALGIAAGLAVPETQKEHELMGPAKDAVMEQAQAKAQDAAEKVQTVAQEAIGAAKDAAQQEAAEQGLTKQ